MYAYLLLNLLSTYRGRTPRTDRLFCCCLEGVWSHDQYQKDQRPWPRRQLGPPHLHRRLHARRGRRLYIPGLDHLKQPQPRLRAQLENR